MKKDEKKQINDDLEKNIEYSLENVIEDDLEIDTFYTIKSQPKFSLIECLESLDKTTFSYYDCTYQYLIGKKSKIKKKDKLIKYYYQTILDTIKNCKENFNLDVINHVKNAKNNEVTEKEDLLLNLGMEFIFEEEGKQKIIIPNEIIDKFNEVFDEEAIKSIQQIVLKELIYTYISINGFIPKKTLIEYIGAEQVDEKELNKMIKQMHGHHYQEWITIFNEEQIKILEKEKKLAEILEKKKKLDYYRLDEYAIQEYKNLTESILIDYDEGVLALLLAMQQSPIDFEDPTNLEEQLDTLKSKINLSQRAVVDELYENYGTIRYWYLNGRTINEYLLEKNKDYIIKKPKKTDLNSLLKLYDENILEEVMDWYEVDNIDRLKERIIEEESLSIYREKIKTVLTTYNKENVKNIINKINFDDIFEGLIYIYKEDRELKYVIPNELLERVESSFTNDNTLVENVI